MIQNLTHRKATLNDLATIIELILEDDELAQVKARTCMIRVTSMHSIISMLTQTTI